MSGNRINFECDDKINVSFVVPNHIRLIKSNYQKNGIIIQCSEKEINVSYSLIFHKNCKNKVKAIINIDEKCIGNYILIDRDTEIKRYSDEDKELMFTSSKNYNLQKNNVKNEGNISIKFEFEKINFSEISNKQWGITKSFEKMYTNDIVCDSIDGECNISDLYAAKMAKGKSTGQKFVEVSDIKSDPMLTKTLNIKVAFDII